MLKTASQYLKRSLVLLLLGLSTTVFAQGELIAPSLTGNDLIEYLQENYTPTSPKSYNSARDAMYGSIDNKNGQIIGVYTGYTITANTRGDAFAKGINTEHTWPQGLFDKNEPMRGDIHHLFPTRVEANSARSNYPFDEIPDNLTDKWFYLDSDQSSIPTSNIDFYSELDNGSRFEPREDHKGNVARSIFYFWTIYQDRSNVADDASFFNGMKDVLLDWHEYYPADSIEVARSIATEGVQGNKNPFIHDSTLVRRSYFGGMAISNELESSQELASFTLGQNYPNPFNPQTIIPYELSKPGYVRLEVFNMLGARVAVLIDAKHAAGQHSHPFNAQNLPGGIYFYRLTIDNASLTNVMAFIK